MFSFLEQFWFIQTVGAIALVFIVIAWNAKTRKNILLLQSVSLMFFIAHYTLLSAYAGAAMSVVVLGRNFVLLQEEDEKNWASHWTWFYFFILISIVVLAFFWNGWVSALPVVGAIVGIYGMWKKNPADIRLYMLIASSIWVPYTIAVHSYSGLLSQIVGIAGILVGMYQHDRKETLPS